MEILSTKILQDWKRTRPLMYVGTMVCLFLLGGIVNNYIILAEPVTAILVFGLTVLGASAVYYIDMKSLELPQASTEAATTATPSASNSNTASKKEAA